MLALRSWGDLTAVSWWLLGFVFHRLHTFGFASFFNDTPPLPADRSAGFYIKFHIFNRILIDSVLKLLLYGPRIRINYCPPGNVGNWSLQHSPESWKYWKSEFFNFLISWKYWKSDFFNFLISWKYWIVRSIIAHTLSHVRAADCLITTENRDGFNKSYQKNECWVILKI